MREIIKDPRIIEKLQDNARADDLDAWAENTNNYDDSSLFHRKIQETLNNTRSGMRLST